MGWREDHPSGRQYRMSLEEYMKNKSEDIQVPKGIYERFLLAQVAKPELILKKFLDDRAFAKIRTSAEFSVAIAIQLTSELSEKFEGRPEQASIESLKADLEGLKGPLTTDEITAAIEKTETLRSTLGESITFKFLSPTLRKLKKVRKNLEEANNTLKLEASLKSDNTENIESPDSSLTRMPR